MNGKSGGKGERRGMGGERWYEEEKREKGDGIGGGGNGEKGNGEVKRE